MRTVWKKGQKSDRSSQNLDASHDAVSKCRPSRHQVRQRRVNLFVPGGSLVTETLEKILEQAHECAFLRETLVVHCKYLDARVPSGVVPTAISVVYAELHCLLLLVTATGGASEVLDPLAKQKYKRGSGK